MENSSIFIDFVVADFNDDKILDIAVIDVDNQFIRVLFGNGDGTFTMGTDMFLKYNVGMRKMSAADVNNDGYNDIVVTSTNLDGFVVCYGNANGTFIEKTTSTSKTDKIPNSIITTDLNKDGFIDIAYPNGFYRNIDVYLGHGNGSFHAKKTSFTGGIIIPYDIVVGDFNEDEMPDIILTYNNVVDTLAVMFGHGDGVFANKIKLILDSDYSGYIYTPLITITDINRDNHLDIAVCKGYPCTITIFYGDGNGLFERHIIFSTEKSYGLSSITTSDLNDDGYPDIISSSEDKLQIFFNTGQCENI